MLAQQQTCGPWGMYSVAKEVAGYRPDLKVGDLALLRGAGCLLSEGTGAIDCCTWRAWRMSSAVHALLCQPGGPGGSC